MRISSTTAVLCWAAGVFMSEARAQTDAPSTRVLAVFDLEAKGMRIKRNVLDALGDTLATWMGEGNVYRVVPRDDLRRALSAQKAKSYKACYAESCQIEIGQSLAADVTLAGQIARIGSGCVVNLRLYNLRTETTLKTASSRGGCSEDALLTLLEQGAGKLTGREVSPPPATPPPKKTLPPPKGMARISAGTTPSAAKKGLAKVSAFQIDRAEVTVSAFRACVEAGACSDHDLTSMTTCNYGRPGRDQHPLNCVDWQQAADYCTWAEKRLPTEAEWSRATVGQGQHSFPWGKGALGATARANIADLQARRTYDLGPSDVKYDDGYQDTAPVGQFPKGASRAGVFDLIGNVAEWTSDWHVPGRSRVTRGGSWRTPPKEASGMSRTWLDPTSREDDVGFRCATSVTP